MKRCPHCDFIYEDEQSLCDMDWIELVPDHRALPSTEASAPRPSEPRRGRIAASTLAAVTSVVILLSTYYVVTRRDGPPVVDRPPEKVVRHSESSPDHATAVSVAAATPYQPPAADTKAADNTASSEPTPAPAKEAKKSSKREAKKPSSAGADGKKESKLGSLFKKAGRILKKPFKH